jgi:hypothetical protein
MEEKPKKTTVTLDIQKSIWNRFRAMAVLRNEKLYKQLEAVLLTAVEEFENEQKNKILKEAGFCE